MKAKDIKPGEVYAYRRNTYADPQPIVFLAPVDADHLYQAGDRFRPDDSPAYRKARPGAKPKRARGFTDRTCGYPAVTTFGRDVPLETLTGVTLAEFEATSTTSADPERGIDFMLVTTLGQIVGEYEEAVAEAKRERKARQEAHEAEQRARQEAQKRSAALVEALAGHGVQAVQDDLYSPQQLVLSFDEVDKLLALLNR